MSTIDPIRVYSLVERHLDNLVAGIQKELDVKTGDAAARFFSRLKWDALVTIISADMQRYANFEQDLREERAADATQMAPGDTNVGCWFASC